VGSPSSDRRRYPRVRLMQPLHHHTVAIDPPFVLRDVNLGGFCIETPLDFPVGAAHEFGFVVLEGRPVILSATAKYCFRIGGPGRDPSYVVGFEFVSTTEYHRTAIAAVVQAAKASAEAPHPATFA